MKRLIIVTMVIALCAVASHATVISAPNAVRELAPTQMADFQNRGGLSSVGNQGNETLNVQYGTSDPLVYDSVGLVFTLPDLGGESIVSAELAFDITFVNNPHGTANTAIDLYAVRYAADTAANNDNEGNFATDHFGGTYAVSGNNGTGIQDDIAPISDSAGNVGRYDTSAAAEIALGTWIQAQYTAGAVAGDYIFLRLSPDRAPLASTRGYSVATADNLTEALRPTLDITTIPEPATISLFALAGLAIFRLRRRFV